jgi:hypothetical protein
MPRSTAAPTGSGHTARASTCDRDPSTTASSIAERPDQRCTATPPDPSGDDAGVADDYPAKHLPQTTSIGTARRSSPCAGARKAAPRPAWSSTTRRHRVGPRGSAARTVVSDRGPRRRSTQRRHGHRRDVTAAARNARSPVGTTIVELHSVPGLRWPGGASCSGERRPGARVTREVGHHPGHGDVVLEVDPPCSRRPLPAPDSPSRFGRGGCDPL